MNIYGYGATNITSGYGTQNVPQTSSKHFTIPVWGEDINKINNAPKTSTITSADDYDIFKDIAETGNFEVPGYIHTKTEPTRSDGEILKEIEELAKEHARIGQSRNNNDKKMFELFDEYISSVSPDRAGILKKSVPEINGIASEILGANSQDYKMSASFQQVDSQRTHKMDEEEKKKELIDYLLEKLEDSNVSGGNGTQYATIKSDMYEAAVQDGKIQYAYFFDPDSKSKGNERRPSESLMMYSEGRLTQQLTKEEMSRKDEFRALYDAAYDVARGSPADPKYSDETYKEAYNRTYEKLTKVA